MNVLAAVRRLPGALLLAGAALLAPAALAQNTYHAGGAVHIVEPVSGDLMAAGGRVLVEAPVARDAALAGGQVTVRSAIGEDLRAVGGQVSLEGTVGGEARLAGGSITVAPGASIARSAWLAGGKVDVQGRLPAGSRIYAGQVTINGVVDGDLLVHAGSIELQPGARINGTLTYASRQPLLRDPAAQVQGPTVQQPMPARAEPARRHARGPLRGAVVLLGLVAAAVVWALLFPSWAQGAQDRLSRTPGMSLAIGAAVVLVAPGAMLLLLVTIIGAPLAAALAAAYGLLLLAGYLVVAGTLGERLLQAATKDPAPSRGKRLLALAAAVVAMGLLTALPVLGWLITVLAVMAGTGALVSRLRPAPRTAS